MAGEKRAKIFNRRPGLPSNAPSMYLFRVAGGEGSRPPRDGSGLSENVVARVFVGRQRSLHPQIRIMPTLGAYAGLGKAGLEGWTD